MRGITAAVITVIVVGVVLSARSTRSANDESPELARLAGGDPAGGIGQGGAPALGGIPVVPLGEAACADAGYLCSGLRQMSPPRAFRWPDGTESLSIQVPLPVGLQANHAREVQRQAAAGIREWQGRPLALRIQTSDRDAEVDARVEWVRQLSGDRIGQATVRWEVGAAGPKLEVVEFLLTTHTPDGRPIDPQKIRLTAAHEMGHVLGLPHSDDSRDVMYPYNTATRLTYRDFRTIEVLYNLPAGARVVPRRTP